MRLSSVWQKPKTHSLGKRRELWHDTDYTEMLLSPSLPSRRPPCRKFHRNLSEISSKFVRHILILPAHRQTDRHANRRGSKHHIIDGSNNGKQPALHTRMAPRAHTSARAKQSPFNTVNPIHNQTWWCGLRPSVLSQVRSETKKIGLGLGLAGLLMLCCETWHGLVTLVVIMILTDTATFQVLFIVSQFSAWNITTVEINSGVYLLKS